MHTKYFHKARPVGENHFQFGVELLHRDESPSSSGSSSGSSLGEGLEDEVCLPAKPSHLRVPSLTSSEAAANHCKCWFWRPIPSRS